MQSAAETGQMSQAPFAAAAVVAGVAGLGPSQSLPKRQQLLPARLQIPSKDAKAGLVEQES